MTLLPTWGERSVFPYNIFPLRCPSTAWGHGFELINVTIQRFPWDLVTWRSSMTRKYGGDWRSPASNSAAVYLIVFFIWCDKKKRLNSSSWILTIFWIWWRFAVMEQMERHRFIFCKPLYYLGRGSFISFYHFIAFFWNAFFKFLYHISVWAEYVEEYYWGKIIIKTIFF